MATEPIEGTDEFGHVSRIRGVLFENLTRAASAVGVVVLVALIVLTTFDALQPETADPEWYGVLAGTFVLPTLLVVAYCWRNRAAGKVGLRAVGAALGGLALATVLVLWLGGQLALVTFVAVVLPTVAYFGSLLRRRQAATVALQALGIVVLGAGVASIGAAFLGSQAMLVYTVSVGLPAAFLARFSLDDPDAASVGVRAIGAASLGAFAVVLALGVAALAGVTLGESAVALVSLGALVAVAGYGARTLRAGEDGRLGLFAPFVLLAGVLAGYFFHQQYVVTGPVVPMLYGLVAGAPALAFAAQVVRADEEEGKAGVLLPLVAALGVVVGLGFHDRYVVVGPTVVASFGLAIVGALGIYAAYVTDRDRPGRAGLLAPLVVGGGLVIGILGTDRLGIAGPDSWVDVAFLTNGSHYAPELTGLHPALVGSLYLMFIVTFVAFPVGIGAAIYLEEYARESRFKRLLEVNIANLAGVPSVVYGLLGVAVFIRFGGLDLGAVLAGGFTLSLLILPIVIVSAQEAIRAVPDSLRQASYGMGATRWQTIRNVVLPRAVPGILTGTILSLGRAVGETAPLIMVGLAPIGGIPNALTDQGTAMPLQVFAWARDARPLFRENVAAAGSMTLLVTLIAMNGVAILIRNKYQRDQ